MLADHDTRLNACKLLLATREPPILAWGGGEAVLGGGVVTGTFAAIGGNLVHDLVNDFLRRWREKRAWPRPSRMPCRQCTTHGARFQWTSARLI